MFNSLVEKQDRRSRRLLLLLVGALLLHGAVLAIVLILDFLRVSPVPQPAVTITLIDAASLAPPPPPPPPPKKPKPQVAVKKVEPSREKLAPKEIPKGEPKEEPKEEPAPSEDDDGADGGVEGGVEGGVAGGVPSAVAPPPPPPLPPPPPAKPVFQTTELASKRRLSGREPGYPQRARLQGWEATLLVRVFISETGTVERIVFIQNDERFEDSVRAAVEGWRFAPHVVDGKPIKTFTVLKFVFKLS